MVKTASLVASLALAAGLCACAPVTSYNGYQIQDVKPEAMKVGEDTKSTVLGKLGSPSVKSEFDPNTWYYISQVSERYAYYQPQVRQRDVVEIKFAADEKVASVRHLNLENGFQVAVNKRETPTRGRELSVLEQILGNIGRGGMLPRQDDPGNPGGHH